MATASSFRLVVLTMRASVDGLGTGAKKGRRQKTSNGRVPTTFANFFAVSAEPNRQDRISNPATPATLFNEIMLD